MLSGKIALKKGHVGLIEDAIKVNFSPDEGLTNSPSIGDY